MSVFVGMGLLGDASRGGRRGEGAAAAHAEEPRGASLAPSHLIEVIDNSIGATVEDADALLEPRAGESPRDKIYRLLRVVLGTDNPGDDEHVRLGLLRMNGGDQMQTFAQLATKPLTPAKLRNLEAFVRFTDESELTLTRASTHTDAGSTRFDEPDGLLVSHAIARALSVRSKVVSLAFDSVHVGDEAARVLASTGKLSKLKLTVGSITDEFALEMEHAKIATLALRSNEITAVGAAALARNPEITTLDLSFNKITDDGARELARSTSIRRLNLEHNPIGDVGAAALARNAVVVHLNLKNDYVQDFGAGALANNKTLTRLNVEDNLISDDGENALRRSEIDCIVGLTPWGWDEHEQEDRESDRERYLWWGY